MQHILPEPLNCKLRAERGFTLVELVLVLMVISVLIGMTLSFGAGALEQARDIQTRAKLDKIEDALRAFRKENDRLPCPASLTLAATDSNYGVEAANAGRCTGGTPAASYTDSILSRGVVGTVPFMALGLSEEFMYDAWGRRFVYVVDKNYTEIEAFASHDIFNICPSIRVYDASNSLRTDSALYVLLSHGPNGHGGYTRANQITNAGSQQAAELANCNCTSTGAYDGSYAASFTQMDRTGTGNQEFDDYVRYKLRWQMVNEEDEQHDPYVGAEIVVGTDDDPYNIFYHKSCSNYTLRAAAAPGSAVKAASISGDQRYWFLGHSVSPYLTALKWNKDEHTYDDGVVTYSGGNPGAPVRSVAASPMTQYVAVGHDLYSSRYLTVYRIDTATDLLIRLAGGYGPQSQPASAVDAAAFSPKDLFLAVGYDTSPYLGVYRRTGDVFSTSGITVDTVPAGAVKGVAFSPNGRYMAVANEDSADPRNYLMLFSVDPDTNTFAKLADPATMPAAAGTSVSFSSDSRYLAFTCYNGTQSLYVYRVDPAVTPALTLITGANSSYGNLNTAVFSPREHDIVMGGTGSPYVTVTKYVPVEDYFSLQSQFLVPGQPAAQVNAIAIRGKYKE